MPEIKMSIDMKKNRIRLFKTMLHLLGDPPFIQLLINPTTMQVAVKALDRDVSGDQSHRVPKSSLLSDNSVEIYSSVFVLTLIETLGIKVNPITVCLNGILLRDEHIALFDLGQLLGKEQNEDINN